jgi:uncharacterized membrane protein YccC
MALQEAEVNTGVARGSRGQACLPEGDVRQLKYLRLSAWDVAYAADMAIACLISYWIVTSVLHRFVDLPDDLLGGMWAAVATVFVFRDSRSHSLSAGVARLIATCVSFALCFAYLCFLPFTPLGMAVLLGAGTLAMTLLGSRDDIITTGITTAVVMVAAAIDPQHAWHQPLLRVVDTVFGITVGVACRWALSFMFYRAIGKEPR